MHKRIFSLLSVGGVVSGTIFAVACGGSSAKPDASVKLKDSALLPDAFSCALSTMDLSNLSGGLGTGSNEVDVSAQMSTQTGQLEGDILLVDAFSDQSVALLIVLSDNMGVFTSSEAGKFSAPPKASTNNQDPDAMIGAGFDILNGVTDNGDGTASINATQGYLLGTETPAQFVITSWAGGAIANGTSTANFEFKNATMDGFTFDDTGQGTSDGCAPAVVSDLQTPNVKITWPATIPTGSIRPQTARQPGHLDLDRLQHVPVIRIPGLFGGH